MMRLFFKEKELDYDQIFDVTSKGYGVKNPARINGYAGVFLFTVPDVYVSDEIEQKLIIDPTFSQKLMILLKRFNKDDYGKISSSNERENIAQRYMFGHNTWMKAKYETELGVICFRTFYTMSLFYFDNESIDSIISKQTAEVESKRKHSNL